MMDPLAERQALARVIETGMVWHCLCAITRLGVAERLAAGPLPLLDWPAGGTVADIAGGIGVLIAAVLEAAPRVRGILVEQPWVLERTGWRLERVVARPGPMSVLEASRL
jgi:hypothetical protein